MMKRFYDGVELQDNLYPHFRGSNGKWRYKNPASKKFITIKEKMSVQEANNLAASMNEMVKNGFYDTQVIPKSQQTKFYVEQYFKYKEELDKTLLSKNSWSNRKNALKLFANEFKSITSLELKNIRYWWDDLTYHQQKLRMAAFRQFFNWMMGEGLCPKLLYNPFTTADDLPRLLPKLKPKKQRPACNQITFDKILKTAGIYGYPCLQIAMQISRYTTLREGDICTLQFNKNVVDNGLQVVVSKSLAQKGSARASRLRWNFTDHPLLKSYIDRARELSLINKACPFIISHTPKKRIWNETKIHLCQVTGDRLSRMFKECRGESKTTFHEIRGLSATLLKIAGNIDEDIQSVMSHESLSTTKDYQDADALPYVPVIIKI